jgi:tRNA(fMet)-specific endonuclease VapC
VTLHVLDTDTLVLFQEGNDRVCRRVLSRRIDDLATTAITIEEQLSGWYTLLRRAKGARQLAHAYQRLVDSVQVLARLQILSFTEPAIERFMHLKAMRLGVRHPDLRIAAITLEYGGTLVTRNVRDFQTIPDLSIVDWSS